VTTPGDPALAPPHPEDRVASDSIARNTFFATLNGVLTAAIAVVLTLYLIRALDPHGYGLYTLALAVGALFALVMDLGISSSAARFIAERRGDRRAIADYVADALRLKILLAGVSGVVLFAAAGGIADLYGKPSLTWPLRGVALALVLGAVMQLFGAVLIAQGRLGASLLMSFAQSVAFLAAAVGLVAAGAGATGAAFGRAIGYGAAVVVGSVLIARLFGRRALAIGSPRGRTRQIAAYAGALAVVEGAYLFFDQLDALLIGAFKSAAAVGLFQAAFGLLVKRRVDEKFSGLGIKWWQTRDKDHVAGTSAGRDRHTPFLEIAGKRFDADNFPLHDLSPYYDFVVSVDVREDGIQSPRWAGSLGCFFLKSAIQRSASATLSRRYGCFNSCG